MTISTLKDNQVNETRFWPNDIFSFQILILLDFVFGHLQRFEIWYDDKVKAMFNISGFENVTKILSSIETVYLYGRLTETSG